MTIARIQRHTVLMMLIVLTIASSGILAAQSDRTTGPDIRRRLEMIERGQGEAVRAELPTLMTNFQNNPGVLYLQAILTTDGAESVNIYQSIVDNFPTSEWGDDALYKLYQYYYSVGLYKTAEQKFEQLKRDYPYSAYGSMDSPPEAKKPQVQEAAAEVKSPSTVAKFTTTYTVQVGAFSTLQNAEELKARFEKERYTCNIFTIVQNAKRMHKVWVGEFQTYDEAKRVTGEIRKKFNLESIVVSR